MGAFNSGPGKADHLQVTKSHQGSNPGMSEGQAGKLKGGGGQEWPALVGVAARESLQVNAHGQRRWEPAPLVFPEQPEPRVW